MCKPAFFERRKYRIAAAVGLGYRTRRQMGKAMVTFTLDTRLCQSRFDFGVPALFVKCYFCVEEYAVGAEFLCTLRYDSGCLGKRIAAHE